MGDAWSDQLVRAAATGMVSHRPNGRHVHELSLSILALAVGEPGLAVEQFVPHSSAPMGSSADVVASTHVVW